MIIQRVAGDAQLKSFTFEAQPHLLQPQVGQWGEGMVNKILFKLKLPASTDSFCSCAFAQATLAHIVALLSSFPSLSFPAIILSQIPALK